MMKKVWSTNKAGTMLTKEKQPSPALLLSTSLSVVEFKERTQRTWSANPAILFQHRTVLGTVKFPESEFKAKSPSVRRIGS